MSDLLANLVTLHADYGLEGVKEVEAYQRLCVEHRGNRGLGPTLNRIRDVYERLEEGFAGLPKEQVKFALEEVSGYRGTPDRLWICRELVLRHFGRVWSEAQQAYFAETSQKLENWHHYFLSFTTYHPTPDEVLAVNNQHSRLIDYGLKQVFGPPKTMTENLLARLVKYLLESYDLHGFYYPHNRDERPVEERLASEASRSLAFVQIVQSSMFRRWPNFCKIEYDAAVADETRLLVFVMSEPRDDFVKQHSVDYRLRDWYDVVMARDAMPLTSVTEEQQIDEALASLKAHVVKQVQRSRDRLFDAIPN